MSNNPVQSTTRTAKQTAFIRFMADGSIEVKLSGIEGITARALDSVQNALMHEVNRLRAAQRNQYRQKATEAAKQVKE